VHGVDGLQGCGPVPGHLAGQLPDDISVAAQREHSFLAVTGHRKDLDPADHQDIEVRGRIHFLAHRDSGRKVPGQAQIRQNSPFVASKKTPEPPR
jgi:hypothetical protein